jgi:hypothetical protein
MTEHVAAEIWREIKRYINPGERTDAAETVLSVMIDHDCDPADIRAAFGSDAEMKRVLQDYLDDHQDDEDDEEEIDDDDSGY